MQTWTVPSAPSRFFCVYIAPPVFNDGKTKVRFIIRNGFYKLISDTEFLQFSIADRKHLYFMTGTPETGLKITFQDSLVSDNRYVQINKTGDAGKLLPFCGDYEFRFDDECKLYYIQK